MIKVSHSSLDTYKVCPKKYDIQYNQKIYPVEKSSALLFGSALDLAFNEILPRHKEDAAAVLKIGVETFNKAWEKQEDKYNGTVLLSKNPNVSYTKKDFDEDIITEQDQKDIDQAFEEYKKGLEPSLQEEFPFDTSYEFFSWLRDNSVGFNEFTEDKKIFYNYVNWLSVKRKAPYILEAYIKDFFPVIHEVVEVQKDLSTADDEGNILRGVADFIVKLKDGTYGECDVICTEPIIADNKSSGKLYAKNSVETSPQLAKYKVILNEQGLPVKKGAYFVILKELKKTKNKTCKSCGHKTTGAVKTCDNKIDKKRCGGDFEIEVSISATTQLVVQDIPDSFAEVAMEEVDSIVGAILERAFAENLDSCFMQFGRPCPYLGLCKNGSMHGLVKSGEKK